MSEQHPSPKIGTKVESSDKSSSEEKPSKGKKEIHVVSVPHENDMIATEMAELFEEDQVTHQHGSAEPEGD